MHQKNHTKGYYLNQRIFAYGENPQPEGQSNSFRN